jgi:hypothetical protein
MLRLLCCALCVLLVLAPPLTAAWSPCTRARIEFADRSSAAVCAAYFSTQHMFPPLTAVSSRCTRARIEFADRSSAAVCAAYFSTQHMFPPPQSLRVRVADLPATYPSLSKPRKHKKRQRCMRWIRRVLGAW